VKIVPLIIQEFLTPISLAYWIMDDGEFCNGGLRLNTYGFKKEEIFLLKEGQAPKVVRPPFGIF